jgi:hypothetical protein
MFDDARIERGAVHAVLGELGVRMLGGELAAQAATGADQRAGADRVVARKYGIVVLGEGECSCDQVAHACQTGVFGLTSLCRDSLIRPE